MFQVIRNQTQDATGWRRIFLGPFRRLTNAHGSELVQSDLDILLLAPDKCVASLVGQGILSKVVHEVDFSATLLFANIG